MSYALIKACIEDQPATVAHLFAQTMAEKVGAAYDAILPQVGKQIGSGAAFDYDAINIQEAVAAPGSVDEVPLSQAQADMVGFTWNGQQYVPDKPPVQTGSKADATSMNGSLTGSGTIATGAVVS